VLVVRWIRLIGFIAAVGLWLMPLLAMGRDDGRYETLHSWAGRYDYFDWRPIDA
jgi:hypothetical protein